MDKNYTWLHLHTELSLLDSCTNYKLYVDKAKELNMKSIAFTEHGVNYSWISKKMYCDKMNIRYIHGCEVYLTETLSEKIRDNYHTILLAKNYEGVKELNILIGLSSTESHKYYKPRISFEEFFNISDNIIKISACLASPLNRYKNKENYSKDIYDRLCKKYDYYEIQPHASIQQIEYNKYLLQLSKQYNKPLIMGTDIHAVDSYKQECRSILQKAKRIEYEDEDKYDLTCKNYEELLNMCKIQNCFEMDVYLNSIENTNVVANMIEDFELDLSFKYPVLYENEEEVFKKRIIDMYKDKINKGVISNDKRYLEAIKEEVRVFKKIKMIGFMLFMSELMSWCNENNIAVGTARGSVAGSTVAYITDITDVDPIKRDTVFSRFANESRIEVGDIDVDIAPDQRHLVYEYIINRFGKEYTSYILAIGTMAEKGTIDEIGRALNYNLDLVSKIKDEYEYNQNETRLKYPELFYYFDGLLGTTISQSMHPAGIVASPISLKDNYGVFESKDGLPILCINMEEIHDVSLIKYDILGLKNVQIIRDVCDLIGCKYPKAHELNWDDEDVWIDICNNNIGIFQFEGNYAGDLLKKWQARSILDLSLLNASLRPSGASYRDRLINGDINSNPSNIIDDLLKDNRGYLIFQEDIIAFLQKVCGLNGSEADNVRRAIGRKDKERLDKALPSILEGYCKVSDKHRDVAEKEAKEFLQIIEDASSYMFGKNHSQAYSMIGYMCGYFRYHNPIQFCTSYLNNANNEDDIKNGFELCKYKNINTNSIKFGYSKSGYFPDIKTNSIYKGLSSVKYVSKELGNELSNLYNNKYDDFLQLLTDINSKTSCNSNQLTILIKLDYFSEFGKSKYLLSIVDIYNNIAGRKQIKKDQLSKFGLSEEMMDRHAKSSTAKMYKDFDDMAIIKELIDDLENLDISLKDKIATQLEYLGYVQYTNEDISDKMFYVLETKFYGNKKDKPYLKLLQIKTGKNFDMKITTGFELNSFIEGDIIKVEKAKRVAKKKKGQDGKYYTVPNEFNIEIERWGVL